MLTNDTIEIFDLEYDVAGVGATEAPSAEANHAAHYFVSYRLADNSL